VEVFDPPPHGISPVNSSNLPDVALNIPNRTVDFSAVPELTSESELLYDWRFTAYQFGLAPSPLRFTARIIFQLNTCVHIPYVKSSLTRGWGCRLQLLLTFASAFILRTE
jgi:hypothetical protein